MHLKTKFHAIFIVYFPMVIYDQYTRNERKSKTKFSISKLVLKNIAQHMLYRLQNLCFLDGCGCVKCVVNWKDHGLPVQIHDYYIMIYLASYYVENYVLIVINNLHEIIYLNIPPAVDYNSIHYKYIFLVSKIIEYLSNIKDI